MLLASRAGVLEAMVEPVTEPLANIQQRIESTRQTRDALQSVRDRLDQQLADIERRQGELSREIAELEAQLRAREQRIAGLKRQRKQLDAEIRRQQRLLAGQMRSAYAIGHKDWMKLLLNQEEPSRLARVLAYYGYLNQSRSALIQTWREDHIRLGDLESELNGEMTLGRETRRHVQHERADLQAATQARRQLLASWDRELSSQAARLAQLREDERRLAELVKSVGAESPPAEAQAPDARSPSVQDKPRKARCPPAGALLAAFGSPRLSGRWDGLLIAGREGAPVRSVAGGQVAFADWFRGYGLLLILDHGDGVMSLYAFNQTLYKRQGDAVTAGEMIAAVGSSGGRDKPGLYFGIRRNGQPVDPVSWCAGRA